MMTLYARYAYSESFIMKSTIILALLLGAAIANSAFFSSHSLSRAKEQVFPHIVEYIDDFSLSSVDLKRLLDNQFRQITISDVVTTAYEVHESNILLAYDGSTRKVEQVSPLKVKVTNDSLTLTVNFQAKVIRALGSKNYSCTAKIPQLMVSYTKAVDFDSGNTLISDFSSSYSSLSFSPPTCKETVAKNDGSSLADAVNSTKSASLYSQLKKIMDRIQAYMSGNAKDERLSRVYDTNPYSYDYYGFKMDVSVSTIEANILSQNRIENAISGVIPDSSFPAVAPPEYEQGYSTFYSLEFIKGAIEYAAKNYGAWREIKLNRNNMRTSMFRWRLIDFQYIVPAVLAKNPQSYLNDLDLICELEEVQGVQLDEKQLQVSINWRCTAGFSAEDGRRINFLSFLLGLKHSADINLQETHLGVRVANIEINKLQFDYIGEYEVIDPFTVAEYIKEGLFQFQVYTFGTFFKIQSKTLSKKLIPERGIWIG